MLNNVNKIFIFMSQKLDFSKCKSGFISDLRLRAKIGRFVSHKPIFFLEFQDRVIFYADSENGVENLIRFHQMA